MIWIVLLPGPILLLLLLFLPIILIIIIYTYVICLNSTPSSDKIQRFVDFFAFKSKTFSVLLFGVIKSGHQMCHYIAMIRLRVVYQQISEYMPCKCRHLWPCHKNNYVNNERKRSKANSLGFQLALIQIYGSIRWSEHKLFNNRGMNWLTQQILAKTRRAKCVRSNIWTPLEMLAHKSVIGN